MCTLSGSPACFGKYFQISSAVNARIGDNMRTSPLAMRCIAVCAERRAELPAAKV